MNIRKQIYLSKTFSRELLIMEERYKNRYMVQRRNIATVMLMALIRKSQWQKDCFIQQQKRLELKGSETIMGSPRSLFRKLHFDFWDDTYIQDVLVTSNEVFLMSALILNPKTTACGIYEISIKYLSNRTKIPQEEVSAILQKFERDKKIIYNNDTQEIFVLNTMKYNTKLRNYKYLKQLKNELLNVKHAPFISIWFEQLKKFGLRTDQPREKGEGFTIEDFHLEHNQTVDMKDSSSRPELLPGMPQKGKGREKQPNPNVKTIIAYYYEIYKEVMGIKPILGKADAPTLKRALKNKSVEEITNIIDFVVDVYFRPKPEGQGLAGTLKTCFSPTFLQQYELNWQKRKWRYGDQEAPLTDRKWWKE